MFLREFVHFQLERGYVVVSNCLLSKTKISRLLRGTEKGSVLTRHLKLFQAQHEADPNEGVRKGTAEQQAA